MRNLTSLFVACLISAAPFFARSALASCDDPFSNPNNIEQFHLRLSEADWDALRASEQSVGEGCEVQFPYFDAEFRCGDEEPWISIGIRRKKDRSASDHKVPIKLDFNRTVQGQRWPAARGELGFRKLTLNSGQPDDPVTRGTHPTSAEGVLSAMLTEHLGWRLLQEELPEVGGVAYVRLNVHFTDTGEERYQGLHLLIEDIDRTAIRARFPDVEGSLFKTTSPGCVDKVVYDDGAPNAATEAFEEWLTLTPEDHPGTWYERTNEAMHLDNLLRQEALRELFVNTEDTALGRLNNYFALDLKAGKRLYFPWDLDDMFRPQPQVHDPETPLVESCTGRGSSCAPIPLGVNIRDNTELRPRYLEVMCQLTHGVAHESRVLAHLAATDELIRSAIADEVPIHWTPLEQDPLDVATPGTYAAELLRMQEWIPARVQAVRSLIEAEGVTCGAGCTDGSVVDCEFWGVPSQRVCTDGLWSACEEVERPVPAPPVGSGGTSNTGGESSVGGGGVAAVDPDSPATDDDADPVGGSGDAPETETANGGAGSPEAGDPAQSTTARVAGCACRSGGTETSQWSAWGLFAMALLTRRRRRR